MAFHSRDGLNFERLADGCVHIFLYRRAGDSILDLTTLNASEWASVMASMSARGESGATWVEFKSAHERDV